MKVLHNILHIYGLKCGYCAAIARLCAAIAQSNVCGGAGEAIATSVPGLLEMFLRSPHGARLLASCQPPAGRAYAYVVARDNHRANAINKLHSVSSDVSQSPYGICAISRWPRDGNTSMRRPPPNLNMSKFEIIHKPARESVPRDLTFSGDIPADLQWPRGS